jgi:hypothetical protein
LSFFFNLFFLKICNIPVTLSCSSIDKNYFYQFLFYFRIHFSVLLEGSFIISNVNTIYTMLLTHNIALFSVSTLIPKLLKVVTKCKGTPLLQTQRNFHYYETVKDYQLK